MKEKAKKKGKKKKCQIWSAGYAFLFLFLFFLFEARGFKQQEFDAIVCYMLCGDMERELGEVEKKKRD